MCHLPVFTEWAEAADAIPMLLLSLRLSWFKLAATAESSVDEAPELSDSLGTRFKGLFKSENYSTILLIEYWFRAADNISTIFF